MLLISSDAIDVIRNFFIEMFLQISFFKVVIGCSVHELREGSGKAAACARRPCRDSGEVIDF
jgi:hypothetical protein